MADTIMMKNANREDLIDIITNISPDENFLQGKFGRTTVQGMSHDWLCDSIRPAGSNRQKEDADFATAEGVARIRMNNYIQHFMVGYKVTDAQEAVLKAGVKSEVAYQMVKASKELSRDLEYAIVRNEKAIAGVANQGGQFGGVRYFNGGDAVPLSQTSGTIKFANHKLQTGGAVVFHIPTGGTMPEGLVANKLYFVRVVNDESFKIYTTPQDAQSDTSPIVPKDNGTKVNVTRSNVISLNGALTEDALNNIMEMCWKQGAKIESAVMSGKNKRTVSSFTAGVQKIADMGETKRKAVVDVWETDFGLINLEAHRQADDDRIDFFEYQYWKLAFLKPFAVEDVPRKGTYTEKVITGMVTIENRSPVSNGTVIGIA